MRFVALLAVLASSCQAGSKPAVTDPASPVPPDVLAIVAEGSCERLRVSILENDTFVHWNGHVGRWNGSTLVDLDTLGRGAARVGWIEGRFPDNAWLLWSDASKADHAMRWENDHWELVWGAPKTHALERFNRTPNGAWGMTYGGGAGMDANGRVHLPHATDVGVPAPMNAGVPANVVLGVAVRVTSGEAFALVEPSEKKFEVRRMRPGEKPTSDAVTIQEPGTIVATKTKVFVIGKDEVAIFDGTTWRTSSPGIEVLAIDEAPDGSIWMMSHDKILRDGKDVTPSDGGEWVRRLAGVKEGAPFAVTQRGVFRWQVAEWIPMKIPPAKRGAAVLQPELVVVKDANEAWLEATYFLPNDNLAGRQYALLKTGPAPEKPYMCNTD